MLELLEELEDSVKRIFQQEVSMSELTALSINGVKGQALILTNRHLFLIYKGFLRKKSYKFKIREIDEISIDGNILSIQVAGNSHNISFPSHKKNLLPRIKERLDSPIYNS